MKIIHFSLTELSGAPIKISKALNKNNLIQSFLVDYKKSDLFEQDLIWEKDKKYILKLIKECDIIHLHNYIHLDSKEFYPINFRKEYIKGKKIIIQYHSSPEHISSFNGLKIEKIIQPEIPSLVLSQYHERYYLNSKIVPNIINIIEKKYIDFNKNKNLSIFFNPLNKSKIGIDRWHTKGGIEVNKILKKFKKNKSFKLSYEQQKKISNNEVIQKMLNSNIVIDDLVTGSFHLTSLEGLATGNLVLCFIDERMKKILIDFTGDKEIPFISIKLEELEYFLKYLLDNPNMIKELRLKGYEWINKNWSEKKCIDYYFKAYTDLLNEDTSKWKRSISNIDYLKEIVISDISFYSRFNNIQYKINKIFNLIFFIKILKKIGLYKNIKKLYNLTKKNVK